MSRIAESHRGPAITFVYSSQHYRDPKWGATEEAVRIHGVEKAGTPVYKITWNRVHRELVNGQSRQIEQDKRAMRRGINPKDGHY